MTLQQINILINKGYTLTALLAIVVLLSIIAFRKHLHK